ncbi:MAG: VWA domain-containing protein [Flavobacteriia bacterium]|nr:VWA domain-containing protein [Flavobacteriia bacterium]
MRWLDNIQFAHPEWLWALTALPILGIFLFVRKSSGEVNMPNASAFRGFSWGGIRPYLSILSLLAFGCWMVALARPQSTKVSRQIQGGEGIDIMLAVDLSESMLAMDFKPNRLEALKRVAIDFVKERVNDRMGLVVYGKDAYTSTPLTTDQDILQESLADLEIISGFSSSTAIGIGLSTALNRLEESDAKSKIVILISDGVNNHGIITPETAANVAEEMNIRVYTIGIGSTGIVEIPRVVQGRTFVQRARGELDEELLRAIADQTGGRYYRAQTSTQLEEIYSEIDRLEKSKVEEIKYTQYDEHFYPWAILGIAFIGAEFLLKNTLFRSIV